MDPRKPLTTSNPLEPHAAEAVGKAAAKKAKAQPAPSAPEPVAKASPPARSTAISKASVKDLRTRLLRTRDEVSEAAEAAEREEVNVKKTASEELRAKLLEAKQRILEKKEAEERKGKKQKEPKEPEPAEGEPEIHKEKDKKKDKKEKKRDKEKDLARPMPKQQALPLLCREDDKKKEELEQFDRKIAIEEAKARRLEELRQREAQKVQQVHSKAAARKKKEVEDSVRELARKLSQDILEISEIINVENIKEETSLKREGRSVGHFGGHPIKSEVKSEGDPLDFLKDEVKTESGIRGESVKTEKTGENLKIEMSSMSSLMISPEIYAQQMSQLTSMATPEALALSTSSGSVAVPRAAGALEADPLKPLVCTIGWEPNVEPHLMIKLLEAGSFARKMEVDTSKTLV